MGQQVYATTPGFITLSKGTRVLMGNLKLHFGPGFVSIASKSFQLEMLRM